LFILLLVSGGVIGVALYRSITSLLRQIPDGNRDFNAFLPESGREKVRRRSPVHPAVHLATQSSSVNQYLE
jgi:hypothetical protein